MKNPSLKQRLVVVEWHHLGDAILALPFIRGALNEFDVHVCCASRAAEIFRWVLPRDRVLAIDAPIREGGRWRETISSIGVLRRLRAVRPDVVVSVWPDPRVHLFMRAIGGPRRVSFRNDPANIYGGHLTWKLKRWRIGKALQKQAEFVFGNLLTTELDKTGRLQRHCKNWEQIAREIGIECDFRLPWASVHAPSLPPVLKSFLDGSDGMVVILHGGARAPERRWPNGNFLSVAAKVFLPLGFRVVLLDEEYREPKLEGGVLRYWPASVTEYMGLLALTKIVLCGDSFAAHAAAAAGCRVFTLFSSQRPEWFAPFGNEENVIQEDVCPHMPCLDRCVMPSAICLEALTVEKVCRFLKSKLE